jgi:hypothetical protein
MTDRELARMLNGRKTRVQIWRCIPRAFLRHLPKTGCFLDPGQQSLELLFRRLNRDLSGELCDRHALKHRFGIERDLLEVPHIVQHDL